MSLKVCEVVFVLSKLRFFTTRLGSSNMALDKIFRVETLGQSISARDQF